MFLFIQFNEDFYHAKMVYFVKCFFYVYWDDHILFIFHSLMWCIYYWFAYVEPSLHPRDKSNLILVCEPVCQYLVKNFYIYVHKRYWSLAFYSCSVLPYLWYQGDAGLIKCVWKCSLLFNFLEAFWEGLALILH